MRESHCEYTKTTCGWRRQQESHEEVPAAPKANVRKRCLGGLGCEPHGLLSESGKTPEAFALASAHLNMSRCLAKQDSGQQIRGTDGGRQKILSSNYFPELYKEHGDGVIATESHHVKWNSTDPAEKNPRILFS